MHLGRPERAWRAAMMWRTSWLSREVIALPAFIGVVALWWLALRFDAASIGPGVLLPLVAIAGAALLWYCTAMIYACLRFIEEWSHPLTLVNYTLTGLASGLLLCAALAALAGESALAAVTGPAALGTTLVAWLARTLALRRNARLRPRSTLQSATGIRAEPLVQKSMGMSAGSFNTREFFHGVSRAALRRVKLAALGLAFAAPALAMAWALATGSAALWLLALLLQAPGLVADRWLFFAQARHPQNLYYQVVS
jgi:DMSO reductase anchor subunit